MADFYLVSRGTIYVIKYQSKYDQILQSENITQYFIADDEFTLKTKQLTIFFLLRIVKSAIIFGK